MKISEVISRLRSLASEVGDVEVVTLGNEQFQSSDCEYYEPACFEVQNVTALENSWVAFEKGNRDQVVRVF